MRVVHKPGDLADLLDEAQGEAGPGVRQSRRLLGTLHPACQAYRGADPRRQARPGSPLHERDCSVQRRHQKVIEIAPSMIWDPVVREELCAAAVKLCQEIKYNNAARWIPLRPDTKEWFFIEMNPRIQWSIRSPRSSPASTSCVRRFSSPMASPMHGPEVGIRRQEAIPRNGFAVQARITTEDPENKFQPITAASSPTAAPAGSASGRRRHGLRRLGHHPFYDSLLVKLLPPRPRSARRCSAWTAATRVPHPRREDEYPVPRKRHPQSDLQQRPRHHHPHRHTPELFKFKPKRDRPPSC